jgi:ABC-2 type transport system permease protein
VKFREIFGFEFMYQARRIRTWLYFAVLFVVAYRLRDGVVNSPYAIAQETVLTGLLWILMAPAVAGSAAARDVQTRMHPLVYTTPISKADYLGGRFLAAFVLNALILLAVPLGMLADFLLPGVKSEIVGPFPPAVYLSAYGVLALPTAFTFTAVQFSLAALRRRAVVSYLGTVLFFVTVGATAGVVTNVLRMPTLGTLLDPTVRIILVIIPETLTPLGMNAALTGLEGSILANRLLWIGVALAILAFTHRRFRFADRAARTR